MFDVLIVLYLCNAAWVKEPLKKKQVAVEKKTFKAEQIPHDHASGSKGLGDCIQDKIVAGKANLSHDDTFRRLELQFLCELSNFFYYVQLGMRKLSG